MKTKIIELFKKYEGAVDRSYYPEMAICEDNYNELAEDIVKLFAKPDVAPRLSVCENCSNTDFNETMGCKNYFQGFKCDNFRQSKRKCKNRNEAEK